MGSVYSKLLTAFVQSSSGGNEAVVPAGVVWVVKGVDIVANEAGVQFFGSANGVNFDYWESGDQFPSGFDAHHWQGFCVLSAGQTLELFLTGSGSGQASGFELTS